MKAKQCGFSALFRNTVDSTAVWIHGVCGCWKCQSCAEKRLKPAWIKHLTPIMLSLKHVYRVTVEGENAFKALSKRISRRNGKYVRIRVKDTFTVYSDVPMRDCERICRHDAVAYLTRAIKAIPVSTETRKPISTSTAWNQPPRVSKDYKRVLPKYHVTKKAVIEAAEECGARAVPWKPQDGMAVHEALRIPMFGADDNRWDNFTESVKRRCCPIKGKALNRVSGDVYREVECQKTVGSRYGGVISASVP